MINRTNYIIILTGLLVGLVSIPTAWAAPTGRASNSAQTRAKPFTVMGSITAITDTVTLQITPKRGNPVTATRTDKTKCVDRFGKPLPCVNLAIGDQVFVRGLRDSTGAMTLNHVRDFSITRMAYPATITKLDRTKNEITLDAKRLGTLTARILPTTKYFLRGREDGSFDTLCVGAKVTVFGGRHAKGLIDTERVHVAAGTLEKCTPPPAPPAPTPEIPPPLPSPPVSP